ncbi:MAG: HIT domain-containing protein, partial [Alphaproteobacteria bacterium]
MMADFILDPTLEKDTVPVADWPLCRVLLMNDMQYPWLVLVPARPGLRDFHDLGPGDLATATGEIVRASRALQSLFDPIKLNVAALGNMVPQL